MIPKQIFFTWFGEEVPKWADYCVRGFKDANPGFKVDFVWMTKEQIDNSKDESIVRLLKEIDSGNYLSYPLMKRSHGMYKDRYFKLVDLYRYELIKRYGGIYVDCDCYPCKGFDDVLLGDCDGFCCDSYWDCNVSYRRRNNDSFFVGCKKGLKFGYFGDLEKKVPVQDPFYLKNEVWLKKRERFYNCTLKIEECDKKYYIEHFVKRSWKQ